MWQHPQSHPPAAAADVGAAGAARAKPDGAGAMGGGASGSLAGGGLAQAEGRDGSEDEEDAGAEECIFAFDGLCLPLRRRALGDVMRRGRAISARLAADLETRVDVSEHA